MTLGQLTGRRSDGEDVMNKVDGVPHRFDYVPTCILVCAHERVLLSRFCCVVAPLVSALYRHDIMCWCVSSVSCVGGGGLHVLGHSAVAGGIGFPAFFKAVS